MRVVAGEAGGVPLFCPRTLEVRPTMDRVRAAIFSSLAEAAPGARVLDLFAGCGSLGIEALSRGADHATFIEHDRAAADSIRRNLAKTRLEGRAIVQCADALKFVMREDLGKFDLIFADPPYTSKSQRIDFAAQLLDRTVGLLKTEGIFVLEKSPSHHLTLSPSWEVRRQKRYGAAEVLFLASKI